MLGLKEEPAPAVDFLGKEARAVAQVTVQAFDWLGPRYRWYNKIRTAAKGGLPLFQDRNLEEQMEATRSALTLVTRTVNNAFLLAFNQVVDGVKNAGEPPEGWPEKLDTSERTNPPRLDTVQDALVIGWMPLKFLNVAKAAQDKGKGIDYYAEGLVKKLFFKVIGYYCDPAHWQPERLGYVISGLAPDAQLADVNARLGALRNELDALAAFYAMFRFGRAPRTGSDPSMRNTLEESFEFGEADLVRELFLQSLLATGMENFLYRYYLTLLRCTENPRVVKALGQAFLPMFSKAIEVRMRFQASFGTETEKVKLRQAFQEFYRSEEVKPPVETVKEKGRSVLHINYTHRLLEAANLARAVPLAPRQAERWAAVLKPLVLERPAPGIGCAALLEILNTLVSHARAATEGKAKIARSLREFAEDREKVNQRMLAQRRKMLAEAVRKKMARSRRFKALEQPEAAAQFEGDANKLQAEGQRQLEAMEKAIAEAKEQMLARGAKMEAEAQEEAKGDLGRIAGEIYQAAQAADADQHLHAEWVAFLAQHIQDDKDSHYHGLYRNLFTVCPDLSPTEKIFLRKAILTKIQLEESEMMVSPEELRAYEDHVNALKTELMTEMPGVMELKFIHGPARISVGDLLGLGIKRESLLLLLQAPFTASNKPGIRIPPAIARKVLAVNQLVHPFADQDLLLPNIPPETPLLKRINLNRLAKLGGG
ncbi:MAG: hypothetical protein HY423_05060 [Candidatus Lambdaproteobacteria bacterium]|nr:hypothetical protein [Candidatus Lambdaproteobacteria bacterium]